MILLVDTDIIIDVALDRRPFAESASQFLDHLQMKPGTAFLAWHTLSNFHYVVSPKLGKAGTKEFLWDLCQFIRIAPTTTRDALYAMSLDMPDFEDALQVAAAVVCKADVIVTRNTRHYRKSPIPAKTARALLRTLR